MTIVLILAIMVGVLRGFEIMEKTKQGYLPGVRKSANMVDYLLNNE
jgi:hypothetical protein